MSQDDMWPEKPKSPKKGLSGSQDRITSRDNPIIPDHKHKWELAEYQHEAI